MTGIGETPQETRQRNKDRWIAAADAWARSTGPTVNEGSFVRDGGFPSWGDVGGIMAQAGILSTVTIDDLIAAASTAGVLLPGYRKRPDGLGGTIHGLSNSIAPSLRAWCITYLPSALDPAASPSSELNTVNWW